MVICNSIYPVRNPSVAIYVPYSCVHWFFSLVLKRYTKVVFLFLSSPTFFPVQIYYYTHTCVLQIFLISRHAGVISGCFWSTEHRIQHQNPRVGAPDADFFLFAKGEYNTILPYYHQSDREIPLDSDRMTGCKDNYCWNLVLLCG